MLDLKFIRENRDLVKDGLKNKNSKINVDEVIALDEEYRKSLMEVEVLKAQRNKANDEISAAIKAKKNPKDVIDSMKAVSQKIADLDKKVGELDEKLARIVYIIPNLPDKSIPVGGPEANKIVRSWGKNPVFDFKPRTHIEIADILGIVDLGRAAKITGSNFILFMGLGARL